MPEVAVMTDSVAQIPPEIARQHNIRVIPFSIIIQEEVYKDGVDIRPSELYQRMRTEEIVPRTSQPSLGEYLNFYKDAFEQGADSILYVALSDKLSGAFSTASKAAHLAKEEFSGKQIEIFDSRTATIAQGFTAITAAQAARDGAELPDLLEIARKTRRNVGFVAMLETLFYLERGGRIGKAAYLMGNMINIKPLISIDADGEVDPLGSTRGEKKSLERLVNCVASTAGEKRLAKLAVMHADNLAAAELLKNLAEDRLDIKVSITCEFTPVMGAHAGPGVLGLGYQFT